MKIIVQRKTLEDHIVTDYIMIKADADLTKLLVAARRWLEESTLGMAKEKS